MIDKSTTDMYNNNNNDNLTVRSITSTNSLVESKTFLRSGADVLIIILNEMFNLQQTASVLTLLSSIIKKDLIKRTLLMLSHYNQKKRNLQKNYFILGKRHSKHLEIYSCIAGNDEKIDCTLEWKTKQPSSSPRFPATSPNDKYTNIIETNPIFIFIGQYIPSVPHQFIDSSQELTRKVMYITSEEESTNVNLDHILEHHCIITVHVLRL